MPGDRRKVRRVVDGLELDRRDELTGEIFLNGGTYHFAESINSRVRLRIDNQLIIDDDEWDIPSKSGPFVRPPGWYPFELRMSNGDETAGAVTQSGWTSDKGFGYNINGPDTTNGDDYIHLRDDGTMTLLRYRDFEGCPDRFDVRTGEAEGFATNRTILNGTVYAFGAVFDIDVYYGLTDEGTNGPAWDHQLPVASVTNTIGALLRREIDGLLPDTDYSFRFRMHNVYTSVWAETTGGFRTLPDPETFPYHMTIDLCGYTGNETLIDFPVLLQLNESIPRFDYTSFAPGAADLRIMNEGRTSNLVYEIQRWNPGGDSHVWVKIPGLTNNMRIEAIWGDPTASSSTHLTNRSVWSAFAGVWHLDGDARDAGPGRYHGTATGTVEQSGRVAAAMEWEGEDSISLPQPAFGTIANEITISVWQFGDSSFHPQQSALFDGVRSGSMDIQLRALVPWDDGMIYWDAFGDFDRIGKPFDSPMDYADQWNLWTFTKNRVTGFMRMYLNGREWHAEGDRNLFFEGINAFALGSTATGTDRFYDGRLDEFRLSNVERSSNWIHAAYLNMNDPETFACYFIAPTRPAVDTEPVPRAVSSNHADLAGNVISAGGAPTRAWIHWGDNDGGTDAGAWDNRFAFGVSTSAPPYPLLFAATNLTPGVTYYYRHRASNSFGESWATNSGLFDFFPRLRVFGPGGAPEILHQDKTPTLDDGTHLGFHPVTAGSMTNLFIATNIGYLNLNLASSPRVIVTGDPDFGLVTDLPSVIPPMGSAFPFAMAFDPVASGIRTARVEIAGDDPTAPVFTFDLAGVGLEPFTPSAWSHAMRIEFCGYNRPETLTNFPVLVRLNSDLAGFDYNQFTSPQGWDLRFVAQSNATEELPWEIERWEPGGTSFVWVRAPRIHAPTSSIVALWGHARANYEPLYALDGRVWNHGYTSVWHLAENPSGESGEIRNRIAGAPHGGFAAGPVSTREDGLFGHAQRFGPATRELDFGPIAPLPEMTLECWFSLDRARNQGRIFSSGDDWYLTFIDWISGGPYSVKAWTNAPAEAFAFAPIGEWHHFVLREPASGPLTAWVDGQLFHEFGDGDLAFGDRFTLSKNGFACEALIDEVRISTRARSTNWIWATAMTTMENPTFQCYHPVDVRDLADNDNDGLLDAIDPDDDNDGFSDVAEIIANTDPFDAGSFLWLSIESHNSPLVRILEFPTSTGRIYTLESRPDLFNGIWSPVRTNLTGTGNPLRIGDTNLEQRMYYRIRVETP
ncbi:MAG: LamG-like jellyroll fold domain-containing protein [Verrucomicrobiota bacterium]